MLQAGMPYDLFWHGDFEAVDYYLEMDSNKKKYDIELINQTCYLQGQYIYVALCCVSPLFRAAPKSGTIKAHPYPDKPFDIGSDKQQLTPEQEAERDSYALYRSMRIAEIHEKAQRKE